MSVSRREFVAAVIAAGATGGIASSAQSTHENGHKKYAPVYVVATITVKQGAREKFATIFKDNVPNVLAEKGCIFYEPVVDMDSGIAAQAALRPDVMVVMEKWESLDALLTHLDAPHMHTYREKVKGLVENVNLQVLESA